MLKYNIVHLYVIIIIACVVICWYSYLSRVYLPASNNSVCSSRVLEEEETQLSLTHAIPHRLGTERYVNLCSTKRSNASFSVNFQVVISASDLDG